MDGKHEFGSRPWMEATCLLAENLITRSGVDLEGIDYTFGEEFVGVPDRLNPAGTERIGWTVRILDGAVTTSMLPPPDDADLVNLADWGTVEPLSHWVAGQDLSHDAEVAKQIEQLKAEGNLVTTVRRERPPVLVEVLAPLHNEVVAITGPRQG